NYVHASVVDAWKRDADSGMGATHREDPVDDKAESRTRDLRNGHRMTHVRAAVVDAWKRDADSGMGATHREDPFDDKAESRTRDLGNGHCMLDMRKQRMKHYAVYEAFVKSIAGGEEYVKAMKAKYGEERGKLL